jgi:hypothetical protein
MSWRQSMEERGERIDADRGCPRGLLCPDIGHVSSTLASIKANGFLCENRLHQSSIYSSLL